MIITPQVPVLKIQEELRKNKLNEIVSKYSLKSSTHSLHPNLVLLKYKQGLSPMEETLVQECRGIILDSENDWKVVCWPYKKFFNFGEPNAVELVWENAFVNEKLDGSLITLYWYGDQWHVASSGTPEAKAQLKVSGRIFKDLFWEIWEKNRYALPKHTHLCYMFELLTPQHIILVRPETDEIILHGVRNLNTLKELDPHEIAKEHNWKVVSKEPLTSVADIIEKARTLDPFKNEGYVVCDNNFDRVKIKAPQYVALSHLSQYDAQGLNMHNVLEVVRAREGSEFLTYYPEYQSLYDTTNLGYQRLIKVITNTYNKTIQTLKSKSAVNEQEFKNQFRSQLEVHKEIRPAIMAIGHHMFTHDEEVEDILSKMTLEKLLPLVKAQLSPQEKFDIETKVVKKQRRAGKKNRQQKEDEKLQQKMKTKKELDDLEEEERKQVSKRSTKKK